MLNKFYLFEVYQCAQLLIVDTNQSWNSFNRVWVLI